MKERLTTEYRYSCVVQISATSALTVLYDKSAEVVECFGGDCLYSVVSIQTFYYIFVGSVLRQFAECLAFALVVFPVGESDKFAFFQILEK